MSRLAAPQALVIFIFVKMFAGGNSAVASNGQNQTLDSTHFEAFATNPSAIVVWARPIGRLESAASRAIVTAITVQDRQSSATMHGLRIDLIHLQPPDSCNLMFNADLCANPNAAIYVEEEDLARVRDGVSRGNAGNLIMSFSKGRPGERVTGLLVGGYEFDGRQPDQLAALIDRGIVSLRDAPR